MNRDDTFDVIRLLGGYWPSPEMTDDEARVWSIELSSRRLEVATSTIRAMAEQGRAFRPTCSEFIAEYRLAMSHQPQPEVVDRSMPELEVTTERRSPEEWMAFIRKQLADCKGPMAESFDESVERVAS
jgi:hypothetical protein